MRALIFGGTGQIGRATALEFARAGWQVDAVTRSRPLAPEVLALGVHPLPAGPTRAALIARGYDAVIDTLAFTAADAADLLAEPAGHLTVISTASVYADAQGRGFERTDDGFPHYPDPIPETQPLVPPGEGYSAGKVALEAALGTHAAILRPGAIHGIGARHPREWYFVKRALDGRKRLPLADGGSHHLPHLLHRRHRLPDPPPGRAQPDRPLQRRRPRPPHCRADRRGHRRPDGPPLRHHRPPRRPHPLFRRSHRPPVDGKGPRHRLGRRPRLPQPACPTISPG